MKVRVRAIIIEDNSILLIHRIKKDKEYWVFPGGGVEDNETENTALIREAFEELGVRIAVKQEFYRGLIQIPQQNTEEEVFYFCSILSGKLGTGKGKEFERFDKGNIYLIEWLSNSEFIQNNILPEEIKRKIMQEVFGQF